MSRTVLIVGLIAGLAASGSAWGTPVARQAIENPWKICASEAARQEAEFGLPRHLLAAVGKAESGRWDEANRANVAWPWTVTAEGEGRFFNSAAEALAEVRRLKARKVANIDVGCMQVNLGYHGQRFFSVEEAMDPAVNTAYAARFLKSLRETSADW
ncbi:MAG: murein transglycosylase, partial [Rhodospirillales bacterium]|nr:murein transglycosylase [Rhodospirillales bacterium]